MIWITILIAGAVNLVHTVGIIWQHRLKYANRESRILSTAEGVFP